MSGQKYLTSGRASKTDRLSVNKQVLMLLFLGPKATLNVRNVTDIPNILQAFMISYEKTSVRFPRSGNEGGW